MKVVGCGKGGGGYIWPISVQKVQVKKEKKKISLTNSWMTSIFIFCLVCLEQGSKEHPTSQFYPSYN